MQEREKEKRAICFSLIAGIILLIAGIMMAIKTDSKAMLADALYDSIDIIIVILTLFLIKLYHTPISEKKPFGFSQLESFFLLIKTFMILASTNEPEKLIDEIKQEFIHHSLDEAMFQRMKKVWIANEVKMADYIDSTVNNIYDDMIRYHKVIPNKVDIIRRMDMKTLEKIVSSIDFHNMSVVTMMPQEEVL